MSDNRFTGNRFNRRRNTDVVKDAIKEATKEWMDQKYNQLGRWTFRCGCALVFAFFIKGLLYLHIVDLRALFVTTTEFAKEAR